MSFKNLMDSWNARREPVKTREQYAVNLPLNDASRLHALADLYPDVSTELLITDLLSAALDEIEAAMPYVPGERIIREDDHGDPVYEDVGLTPRFLQRVREQLKRLQSDDG